MRRQVVVGVRSTWMTANDCAATYLRSRLLFASEGRASFLGKGIDMYESVCVEYSSSGSGGSSRRPRLYYLHRPPKNIELLGANRRYPSTHSALFVVFRFMKKHHKIRNNFPDFRRWCDRCL
jgi:hypothetical protein